MIGLTVVAKIVAKREFTDVVKSELLKLLVPTRQEYGCLEYNLHQDTEDPAVFIFHENWKDSACLENHKNSDHYKIYTRAVVDLIEDKVVHKMIRIED